MLQFFEKGKPNTFGSCMWPALVQVFHAQRTLPFKVAVTLRKRDLSGALSFLFILMQTQLRLMGVGGGRVSSPLVFSSAVSGLFDNRLQSKPMI